MTDDQNRGLVLTHGCQESGEFLEEALRRDQSLLLNGKFTSNIFSVAQKACGYLDARKHLVQRLPAVGGVPDDVDAGRGGRILQFRVGPLLEDPVAPFSEAPPPHYLAGKMPSSRIFRLSALSVTLMDRDTALRATASILMYSHKSAIFACSPG